MIDFKNTVLGLELGSTRIKAVLLDKDHNVIATGGFEWENELKDGVWTYSMDDARRGVEQCYKDLKKNLGCAPDTFGAIGISGMMHGYLPFDKDWNQIAMFRTWRNTMTQQAADKLSEMFNFAMPQRWSVAHLYHSILEGEEHVKNIEHMCTLSSYIHFLLTGEHVIGIGEASGMFPIDSKSLDYCSDMMEKFDAVSGLEKSIREILPKVLTAGENAGFLTEDGAKLLDPEGDAGTGMTATNAVRERTGNVSAGTSDFIMLVTDHELGLHKEVNMVTTPAGKPVAMVQCNNCTTDINAWVSLFEEFASLMGVALDKGDVFTKLFNVALEGDKDCGGLLSYNYYSGESVTEMSIGRPLFVRRPDSTFNLANFMRMHLMSSLATLRIGLDILFDSENVTVDRLCGHGGFFKTPGVGQRILSSAVKAPVTTMETAGEGGPYGMALLAAYLVWKEQDETLEDYLDKKVFAFAKSSTVMADDDDIKGFDDFLENYKKAFDLEETAAEII